MDKKSSSLLRIYLVRCGVTYFEVRCDNGGGLSCINLANDVRCDKSSFLRICLVR